MLFKIGKMKIKTIYFFLFVLLVSLNCSSNNSEIKRYYIVSRYNIENSAIDSKCTLSIGNGEFIFTADITGLQTFPEFYTRGIPLETMSGWGWHMGEYRENSYHFCLGLIGLWILKENGEEISVSDIKDPVQKLNLLTGEIDSRFNIEGVPVHLKTVCHPDYDMISAKIISELIGKKRLRIKINFPTDEPSPAGYAFNTPQKHTTKILSNTNNLAIFRRNQDNYNVIVWRNDADLKEAAKNLYYLEPNHADSVYSFSCQFLNNPENGRIQNFGETEAASKKSWEKFWTTSSAVDFQEYNDPKSKELEERIILSRYFAKIQCCGSLLQAGADTSYNNWFGKFHLEMHSWLPYHTIPLNGN
jgi:hypothetical protein